MRQQHISKPIVAVSVRDWPSEINFKERIARALDRLAQRNYSIVFVPMHGVHDYKTSMDTAALMKNRSFIAPGNISIGEKISIIGQANLLIGMRLHALIFSAITATPLLLYLMIRKSMPLLLSQNSLSPVMCARTAGTTSH